MSRIFILSPAKLSGRRAELLLSSDARFDLAKRLQDEGVTIGEVFSFLSGLYFRGKLTYANHFSRPYRKVPGVVVITSNRGLIPVQTIVTVKELISLGSVPIEATDPRYAIPLESSATQLFRKLPGDCEVVLLGSIGTPKYVEPLLKIFKTQLAFPLDFVGRGDMSRGGLLLRCVTADRELEYVPLAGAIRHGKRPPKLERLARK